jgi:hypothetical protein
LEAKKNLGLDTFTVLDKGYHNGRKLPNVNNNIPLLLPILRQEEAKKVLLNPNGSSISVQQIRRYLYMSPGEILKTTGDGTRKAVEN